MAADDFYREHARRSHKLLGAYLAFWAWTNKVSCVALNRGQLRPFLDLKNMHDKRIEWLKEDIEEIFPHIQRIGTTNTGVFHSLFLSRVKFPDGWLDKAMTTQKRVELLKEKRLRAAIVMIPPESEIIRRMAELAHGISDFSEWVATEF